MGDSIIVTNSVSFRDEVTKRNLYTPTQQYPLDDPTVVTEIVNAISSVVSVLAPFRGVPISDSLLGRVLSDKTPMGELNLIFLAKQLAYTTKDNLISKVLPVFNPTAIFNGEKLFEKKINYKITKEESTTFIGAAVNFLSNKYDEKRVTAKYIKTDDNDDRSTLNSVINNTGTAQLNLMVNNISGNKYIYSVLYENKTTSNLLSKANAENLKYTDEFISYNDTQYKDGLKTKAFPDDFIWGVNDSAVKDTQGLLKYTKDVLNKRVTSRQGNYPVDDGLGYANGDNVSYNGSNLVGVPENALDEMSSYMRQHSAKSPYGINLSKAIRSDGNKVYGGNENSVIYNSVIPKIHPNKIYDKDKSSNKNMMFSIENLAVKVISKGDGYGIIDDDKLTKIPESEVGAFNGRVMWFPPYDIRFNETTATKYDETMMVGRGEPMYTYMNTTRTGTLNFTLLIDYPPQLKSMNFQSEHAIADFFAFGYKEEELNDLYSDNKFVSQDIEDLTKRKIETVDKLSMDNDILISFPNNFPSTSEVNNAFYIMFNDKYEVGIYSITSSDNGLNKNIYNITNYIEGDTTFDSFLKLDVEGSIYGQYKFYDSNVNLNYLDNVLIKFFTNSANNPYYDIMITTGASKLNTENQKAQNELCQRRADAIVNLIKERYNTISLVMPFGEKGVEFDDSGINIIIKNLGDSFALDVNKTEEMIDNIETKKERFGTILIQRNSKPLELVDRTDLNEREKTKLRNLKEKAVLTNQNISDKTSRYDHKLELTLNDKDKYTENSSVKSLIDGRFSPVFHSQTPEEFHRRLTFLQQCMRQGKSIASGIKNTAFGAQPICILRVGDHLHSKVIINSLNIEYEENMWDMNPEGFGMQPMLAKITLQLYIVGGQSMEGPIDALQNALSFNHYANSTFYKKGMYSTPVEESRKQVNYNEKRLAEEQTKIGTSINNAELENILNEIIYKAP